MLDYLNTASFLISLHHYITRYKTIVNIAVQLATKS